MSFSSSSSTSSDQLEHSEGPQDPHHGPVRQAMAPRSHQADATHILNNLLKEYDKTLRPDIGGELKAALL